ncbi:stannin isoform 2-T3 [Sylvia borin]
MPHGSAAAARAGRGAPSAGEARPCLPSARTSVLLQGTAKPAFAMTIREFLVSSEKEDLPDKIQNQCDLCLSNKVTQKLCVEDSYPELPGAECWLSKPRVGRGYA